MTRCPPGRTRTCCFADPDVVEAEYQLRAANGDIGAARAALFPRISLNALLGLAEQLDRSPFQLVWSGGGGDAVYPIFNAGAGTRVSASPRRSAPRPSRRTSGRSRPRFAKCRTRSPGRARSISLLPRGRLQKESAGDAYILSEARYREGIDPFLDALDAQRNFYVAQRALALGRLTAALNQVDLYRTLGGDSLYPPPAAAPTAAP